MNLPAIFETVENHLEGIVGWGLLRSSCAKRLALKMWNKITEILRIVHEQSIKFISKLDRDFNWETHVEVVFSLKDVDTYRIILFIKDHPYGAVLMNNY